MRIISSISEYKQWRKSISPSETIGFVPTMGALHEGHVSLVERSAAENPHTVVSVFVNPTQFGPKEDFSKYPRTLVADAEKVAQAGATIVFAPHTEEIYPLSPTQILFSIRDLDKILCGKTRPGHFNGVVQVVSLLFHIIQPDCAYFGEKDFQQLAIIRRMVQELHFPVHIKGCPIVREADGLAMSSRNMYLSTAARAQAVGLSKILFQLKADYPHLESPEQVLFFVQRAIDTYPLMQLDYFEILEEADFSVITNYQEAKKPRAFIAAFCDTTRLIDNFLLA